MSQQTISQYENLILAKKLLLAQEKEVFGEAMRFFEGKAQGCLSHGKGAIFGVINSSSLGSSWSSEDNLPEVQFNWLSKWCKGGLDESATARDCEVLWKRLGDVRQSGVFMENGRRLAIVHPDVKSALLDFFGPVSSLEHGQSKPAEAVKADSGPKMKP